ncbi:MAG: hypothetical protein ACRDQZ_20945 [Mycobacteriales bacterium]
MTYEAVRDQYQQVAADIAGDMAVLDKRGLYSLKSDQLQRQRDARIALKEYVTALWEEAEGRGVDPANSSEWQCITALRDLVFALESNAADVPGA